jgi:hypothetical protein
VNAVALHHCSCADELLSNNPNSHSRMGKIIAVVKIRMPTWDKAKTKVRKPSKSLVITTIRTMGITNLFASSPH